VNYSYEQAGKIIGWHPSTVAKAARKLGIRRVSTGMGCEATSLDEAGMEAIRAHLAENNAPEVVRQRALAALASRKGHSYAEAETIIGWPRATIAHHAWKLGLARVGGSLDDDGLQAVWEAIEAAQAIPRSLVGERSEASADTSTQVRETVGADLENEGATPSRKYAEPFIIGERQREHEAMSLHFSVSPIGPKTSSETPFPDEDSRPEFCDVRDPDTADATPDDHPLIQQRTLHELDTTIAVREAELATLRRARAVVAADLGIAAPEPKRRARERRASAVQCGSEAQENA
jgi:hypothetical protein